MPALEAIDAYLDTLITERLAAESHVLNPGALPGHRLTVIMYDIAAAQHTQYASCLADPQKLQPDLLKAA